MIILELFSGMECMSNAFRKRGHECFTIDWDERFNSNLHIDISKLQISDLPDKFKKPDIIFAGTDCTTYSVAAISFHRRKIENGNLIPISDKAKFADEMNKHVLDLIKEMNPKVYIIENPVGALRKMDFMQDIPYRNTTTYCQYGFTYRKPTDFFSNIDLKLKPPCKKGAPCHERAPRGSHESGLQKIKDPVIKSMYPPQLCDYIVERCEEYINESTLFI